MPETPKTGSPSVWSYLTPSSVLKGLRDLRATNPQGNVIPVGSPTITPEADPGTYRETTRELTGRPSAYQDRTTLGQPARGPGVMPKPKSQALKPAKAYSSTSALVRGAKLGAEMGNAYIPEAPPKLRVAGGVIRGTATEQAPAPNRF